MVGTQIDVSTRNTHNRLLISTKCGASLRAVWAQHFYMITITTDRISIYVFYVFYVCVRVCVASLSTRSLRSLALRSALVEKY